MPGFPDNNPFDNAGPAIVGISKDFEPKSADDAAGAALEDQSSFDQLGPLTRKAMRESPIRWSAAKALEMIRMQCRGKPANSPQVDAMLAQMIGRAEPDIVRKIRVQDEQAIKEGEREHLQRIVDRAMKPRQRAV